MTREEIIAKVRETAPALRAEGVTKLAIFGSRARGDARIPTLIRTWSGTLQRTTSRPCRLLSNDLSGRRIRTLLEYLAYRKL
jgi:hypothetical protein